MNKLVQSVAGFIFIALSIGILIYIYIAVLPNQSITNGVSPVKIIPTDQVINTKLVEKVKTMTKPANVPVTVNDSEISRDNPFANY